MISAKGQRHAKQLTALWQRPDLTTIAIGRALGVSQTTACVWAKALGLPPRNAAVGRRGTTQRRTMREAAAKPTRYRCVCGAVAEDKRALEVCIHREGA